MANGGGCGCSGGSSEPGACSCTPARNATERNKPAADIRKRTPRERPEHVRSLARREQAAPWPPLSSWRILRAQERVSPDSVRLPKSSPIQGATKLVATPPTSGSGILCGNGVEGNRGSLLAAQSNIPANFAGNPLRVGPVHLLPGLPALGPEFNVAAMPWSKLRRLEQQTGEVLMPTRANLHPVHAKAAPPPSQASFGMPLSGPLAGLPGLPGVFQIPAWIRYRDVELKLDHAFYQAYVHDLRLLHEKYDEAENNWDDLSYGLVSSVGDTLDALWWRIKQTTGDFGVFHDLISCWNLHKNDESVVKDYAFWSWGWGAPHKLHMWTCQMLYGLYIHMDYRLPNWTSVPGYANECQGLSTYIRDLLEGGSPANRNGDACFLSFAYRSDGSDHDLINDWCGIQSDQKLACDEQWSREVDVPNCVGKPWDDWTPEWVEGSNCITGDGSPTTCDKPDTGCESANGRHHDFSIHLHAISMAFDGHVCDHIMYLARMALDYGRWLADQGRANEAMDADAAADLISRYALKIMMERCRLYIHEIGHAWLASSYQRIDYPGDHCEYNCCNDIAASHWCCSVRAYLGLPPGTYYTGGLQDDYDPAFGIPDRQLDKCSHDVDPTNHSRAYLVWNCRIRENGKAGMSPESFCATGCLAGLPVDENGDGNPLFFIRMQDEQWFWGWDGFCK